MALKEIRLYNEQQKHTDIFNDWIILVGDKAYKAYYGKKTETAPNGAGTAIEWEFIRNSFNFFDRPPCLLDTNHLPEMDKLRLAPEKQKYIKIFQVSDIPTLSQNGDDFQTRLLMNLAKNCPNLVAVEWIDQGMTAENVTPLIERIRKGELATAEILQKTPQNIPLAPEMLSDNPSQRELLQHFLAWNNAPLKRDVITGQTYQYNGKHWAFLNDEQLKRLILKFYEEYELDYTKTRINNLADLVITKIDELPTAQADLTAYQNGALNKKTGELISLHPDLNLRGIEPFELKTTLETPYFDNWLSFVTDDDKDEEKKQAILAGLYMILTNRHEWQKFIEITGQGGSGKSVFGHIATQLNGTPNTAFIELMRMEKKPENRACLVGKTLIYSPDQPYYSGDGDTLKAITGGDIITVKYLYKDPIEIKINACYMMTTNNPLLFTDRNGGISRRRIIIAFNRQVPKEKRDPHFLEKIQTEIYGITNRLLSTFQAPEIANDTLEKYRLNQAGQEIKRSSNHLIDFAQHFEIKADRPHGLRWGSAKSRFENPENPTTLYHAYMLYCDCANLRPQLPLSVFKQAFPDALKDNGETNIFREIKLNGYPTVNVHFKDKENTLKEWIG